MQRGTASDNLSTPAHLGPRDKPGDDGVVGVDQARLRVGWRV